MAAKFVKYTDEDGEEDPETLKILKREVAMIQKWEHEKFIILLDVFIVRKYVVLIMEWYVVGSLIRAQPVVTILNSKNVGENLKSF